MTPFVKCWGAGGVPQDTRDASIFTLYKNKGDRSIVGKLYARVLLVHRQQLAECVYPESEGSMSRPFDIKSGVKQGCVLAPTLFEVLFSPLLKYTLNEVVQMHTRSEGRLYNITRLRAKTKECETIQRHALCR